MRSRDGSETTDEEATELSGDPARGGDRRAEPGTAASGTGAPGGTGDAAAARREATDPDASSKAGEAAEVPEAAPARAAAMIG